ncbi:helix-turn-helix transcriptional regulator [Photobacterium minamisatsumaniensis]|uniref:helix-turn-helix transcriptional regulator n=1 Tax=Photobacterium minamisatsumaniensis TaxID=2910233 RepID=UPI003D136FA6
MHEKRTNRDMRFHLHPGWIELLKQGAKTYNIELSSLPSYSAIQAVPAKPDIRLVRQFHQDLIDRSDYLFPLNTAQCVTPFTFGCFSVLLWTSKNLIEYLHHLSEFFILAAYHTHLSVTENEDKIELWIINSSTPESYQLTKIGIFLMVCTILDIMRQLNGDTPIPCKVFAPLHDYTQQKKDAFCRQYNCLDIEQGPVIKLVFKKSDLLAPLCTHNQELQQHTLAFVREQTAKVSKHDIRLQVCHALDELPNLRNVSIQTIARALLTSPRTLNRRLAVTDTNFKTILKNYRLEKALNLLNDPDINMTEIAFQLGFSELSSFSRAFKRWTGEAPSKTNG